MKKSPSNISFEKSPNRIFDDSKSAHFPRQMLGMMGLAQRRSRWAPTDTQRMILEASYKVSAFPDLEARVHLAHQLRVEVRQVRGC